MNNLSSGRFISGGIFASRWLQAPLYIGLIFAQMVYVYKFIEEIIHLILHVQGKGESEIMLIVLGLVDVVMISNLLIMVIVGGYETFVSRLGIETHPDFPEWLDHVDGSTMKIKLAMALIGISSIHLLKTFIEVEKMDYNAIMWKIVIHITFLISALALAYTAKIAKGLSSTSPDHK